MPTHDSIPPSPIGSNGGVSTSRVRKFHSSKNRALLNYLARRRWTPYGNFNVAQLASNHYPFLKRLNFMKKLPVHDGCVNTLCWNKTGEYILSGSDDCYLCITKPTYMFDTSKDYTVLHKLPTFHQGNIFCAQFLPNSGDSKIVSCSSQGPVMVHDIYTSEPGESLLSYNCHSSTIYEVVTVPDNENIFLSCSEDKTIRLFDLRVHKSCPRSGTCPHPALIRNSYPMTTLSLHPLNSNLMLIGRADGLGLVYDRRRLPDVAGFSRERAHAERLAGNGDNKSSLADSFKYRHPMDGVVSQFKVPDMDSQYRFTSLCYNHNGSQVLASYSGEYLYLFDHDTSSNIELVQTLRVPSKQRANGATHAESSAVSNSNSDTNSQGDNGRASARVSSTRVSRIRLRGDWSDTGVNSVPHLRMRQAATNSRTAAAFLEHVTLSLRSRHNRYASDTSNPVSNSDENSRGSRSAGSEFIAGPFSYDTSSNDSASSMTQHRRSSPRTSGGRHQSINEEDEDDDADSSESSSSSSNSSSSSSSSTSSSDSNMSGDDDDDEEMYTVVGDSDSSESDDEDAVNLYQATSRAGRDEERSGGDTSSTATRRAPTISSHTRAKFKKTLEGLKDNYAQITVHRPRVKYQGHRNSRTSIKEAIFWGDDFVMSGSDCGRIMAWHKASAELVMAFQADERVVNCLAPNPHHYVLASSGIDYDIKLWSTQSLLNGPLVVNDEELDRIVENNEIMLEESKNTFSVPPALFFRVLATLARS